MNAYACWLVHWKGVSFITNVIWASFSNETDKRVCLKTGFFTRELVWVNRLRCKLYFFF